MYNNITSITRSELYEKFKNDVELANDKLINKNFNQICDHVMNYNYLGFTKFSLDLKFSLSSIILIEKLVDKLKNFFIDSKIILTNKSITIDWSIPESDIEISNPNIDWSISESDNEISNLDIDGVVDLKDNI